MRASSCVPATFLLIVALAGDSLPVRLVQPLLPGSWMGREDGQPQILSVSQCHGVLKEVGFSGVDASSTPSFCSVMLSQAVRRPASTAQQLETGVLIVHDPSASAGVTRLASQVATELAQVATVRTAGGLEGIRVPAGAVVLNLCDLDTPTWHKMHERRFEGLQEVMRQASALLWVAEGARAGTTLENTTVLGWGRSARVERTTMYIEQEAHMVDPDMVLKLLLRIADAREPSQEMLWSLKPELVLRDNAFYVPVDEPNALADTRYKDATAEVPATSPLIILDERGQLTVGRSYQGSAQAKDWRFWHVCSQASSSGRGGQGVGARSLAAGRSRALSDNERRREE